MLRNIETAHPLQTPSHDVHLVGNDAFATNLHGVGLKVGTDMGIRAEKLILFTTALPPYRLTSSWTAIIILINNRLIYGLSRQSCSC